ncbi:MAG: mobilization protein [Hydrogenophilales bacterium 28-61-23]|nr:MAG: mobilization protein [Hydrogenophilales bacterium 28-61-23]
MSKLHLIGGEKGGVGKSLVARVLAQYLIDHELSFIGFDTDQSHGALLRFYADFAAPVAIDRYESLDRIVEAAVAEAERRVLVDLAAQTHPFLMRWMEDSGLLEMVDELGLDLTYWHVMDSGQDAVDLLRQLLDRFGGRLKLVLVLNEVRGDRFGLLEASGQRARAEGLGAQVMSMRHLQDAAMQKIDGHSSSFWSAVNNKDAGPANLGLLERQRVRIWLNRTYQELAKLSV